MRASIQSSKWASILILSSLLLSSCGEFFFSQPNDSESIASDQNYSDTMNGEMIYFTATNRTGERITFRGGPDFGGMMMGTYLTCASCHGPEARGGYHFIHMTPMDAPDIRYNALIDEENEHADENGEHGDKHADYDLDAFQLAVIEGKHPDGEPLSYLMPRWEMSEEDLRDLFIFLKSIP
jgi:hypothetical protein